MPRRPRPRTRPRTRLSPLPAPAPSRPPQEEEHALFELFGHVSRSSVTTKLCDQMLALSKSLAGKGFALRSPESLTAHIKKIEEQGFLDDEREEASDEEEEAPRASPKKAAGKGKGKGKGAADDGGDKGAKGRWTYEEEAALIKYAETYTHDWRGEEKPDWTRIAEAMGEDGYDRSKVAIAAHWKKL